MKTVIDALKFSCDKAGVYPKIGVEVFRFWVVILAFVGIQLAWNLRPFMGDRGQSFQLFRKYEGNFYTALIYSFKQLGSSENAKNNHTTKSPHRQSRYVPLDSLMLQMPKALNEEKKTVED